MDAQRKVTVFVTRGSGAGAELLVFWHAGAGVQVPAGTVEDGESFEAAAAREAAEETGLSELELVRRFGAETVDLPEGHAVIVRRACLQTRPGGPETSHLLHNVQVRVHDRRNGCARVVYEERDLDAPEGEKPLVYARFEGWVPEVDLRYRQVREFFHVEAYEPTPTAWQQLENDQYVFHLRWEPLIPKPAGLIPGQQAWLDRFYEHLIAG